MRNGHFAILATLILVASATTARAETMVSHFKIKGNTVTATFQATDPDDPCIEFFVNVVASDSVEKYTCTDTLLFSSLGDSFSQGLQVAGDLRSATLKTTVTTADALSLQLYDFDMDLTWTGTGPAVHQNTKETFRDRDLGIFIKSHTKASRCPRRPSERSSEPPWAWRATSPPRALRRR